MLDLVELACSLILDYAKTFYQDPINLKAFQAWKKLLRDRLAQSVGIDCDLGNERADGLLQGLGAGVISDLDFTQTAL